MTYIKKSYIQLLCYMLIVLSISSVSSQTDATVDSGQQQQQQQQCNNKWTNEEVFQKYNLTRPSYLQSPQITNDLSYCQKWNGIQSCCNSQTVQDIQKQFQTYKDQLQQQLSESGSIYRQYILNLYKFKYPKSKCNEIGHSLKINLKQIHRKFVKLNQYQAKCAKFGLQYVASALCETCNPNSENTFSTNSVVVSIQTCNSLSTQCSDYLKALSQVRFLARESFYYTAQILTLYVSTTITTTTSSINQSNISIASNISGADIQSLQNATAQQQISYTNLSNVSNASNITSNLENATIQVNMSSNVSKQGEQQTEDNNTNQSVWIGISGISENNLNISQPIDTNASTINTDQNASNITQNQTGILGASDSMAITDQLSNQTSQQQEQQLATNQTAQQQQQESAQQSIQQQQQQYQQSQQYTKKQSNQYSQQQSSQKSQQDQYSNTQQTQVNVVNRIRIKAGDYEEAQVEAAGKSPVVQPQVGSEEQQQQANLTSNISIPQIQDNTSNVSSNQSGQENASVIEQNISNISKSNQSEINGNISNQSSISYIQTNQSSQNIIDGVLVNQTNKSVTQTNVSTPESNISNTTITQSPEVNNNQTITSVYANVTNNTTTQGTNSSPKRFLSQEDEKDSSNQQLPKPNKEDLKILFSGKLEQISKQKKFIVNNKEIDIPTNINFENLLYFNYQKPCNSSEECSKWVCYNILNGIFLNISQLASPNKNQKSYEAVDTEITEETTTTSTTEIQQSVISYSQVTISEQRGLNVDTEYLTTNLEISININGVSVDTNTNEFADSELQTTTNQLISIGEEDMQQDKTTKNAVQLGLSLAMTLFIILFS